MTFVLLFLGVALVAVSGRLVARAIVVPRLQLKTHLREIADYGFDSGAGEARSRFDLSQAIKRLAERVGAWMMRSVPSIPALKLKDLTAAGFYDVTPESVHGYRVLGATLLPLFILLLVAAGGSISGLKLLLVIMVAAMGWQLPGMYIHRRGGARLDEIDRQLPEVIDLLIATIEAGMGFTSSLDLVAGRYHGALGDELRLAIKQQSLGMSMMGALEDMGRRVDSPMVRAFVRTSTRGESMGVSIGPILRELSADMRRRRRQNAREKMQKAPIKMLFPLMFLVFPALMIVLMYPAAYSVMHNLSGI